MRRNKHKRGFFMSFLLFLVILGCMCFLGLCTYVVIAEHTVQTPDEPTDAIIVLGAQVKADGSLSLQLEWRLKAALEEYEKQPRYIVSCGAQGENEPAPEGEVMTEWLILHGVAPEHVLTDADSYNTKENLLNARALLPDSVQTVLIVTSDYHVPRALAIARDQGLTAYGKGAYTKPEYWLKNHVRETLAWGKYLLLKVFDK